MEGVLSLTVFLRPTLDALYIPFVPKDYARTYWFRDYRLFIY